MTSEEFQKVALVFEAAREMPPGQRSSYLNEVCANTPRIRREVESLLAFHDDDSGSLTAAGADDALRSAAVGVLDELEQQTDPVRSRAGPVPERIDGYVVIREIGAGGMGVVYEARQDYPARTVALKVIRPGLRDATYLRRFLLEAQVLGNLRHPGIAQVYEARTAETDSGPLPYFAMEFVEGEPLSEYASTRNLQVRDRVALFVQICGAVQYAHSKGVIHRDLKPANILVDRAGQPRILDFGVARIADGDLRVTTLQTAVGQVVGTLPYMSPEQVAAESDKVDSRSDVYALGVILFELLCGQLPYRLAGCALPEAARLIRDSEPTRLSTLDRAFRGDLETIVVKALEKEPERRYATVAEFAADLRRFLDDEPILARPPSTLYQLRKFARRRKGLVGGAAAVLLALVIGMVGTTFGLVRARRARELAEARLLDSQQQTGIAEAVIDFLNDDILGLADPQKSPDREMTLRAAIDTAAQHVEERFASQPVIEAAIDVTLGRTYRNLAAYDLAEQRLNRAVALREQHLGHEHSDTLKAWNHLAMLYDDRAQYDRSEPIYRRLLDARTRKLGPDHRDTLATTNNLGLMLSEMGRFEEAEALLKDALERRERLLPADHEDRLVSMNNLASLYWDRGEYGRALPLYEKTLEGRIRTLGPDHPQTLGSMDNLATCVLPLGQADRAEQLNTEMLGRARRVLGDDHPRTFTALNNLGAIRMKQKKFADAEPVLAEAAATTRRVRRPGHWAIGASLSNYGFCLLKLERYEEAEKTLREAYVILAAGLGESHERTKAVAQHLHSLHVATGDAERAAEWREKVAPQ